MNKGSGCRVFRSGLFISYRATVRHASWFNYALFIFCNLRWEDNIKMDLREIGKDGANWIRLTQDRVQWRSYMNTVMNRRIP